MSAVSDIKSQLDVAQIAQLLGTDEATAGQAVDQALESLVGTMDANVADPDQALGLTRALGDHVGSGDVTAEQVDTADGEKIVSHVYSADQIQALSSGAGGGLIRKLLPILAPIVMGYLASKLDGYMRGQTGGRGAPAGRQESPGGLGDVLGGMVGGGAGGSGGLGDLLGQVLGGGAAGGAASGGLGDLLGGILGDRGAPAQPPSPAQTPPAAAPGSEGPFRSPAPGDTSLNAGTPEAAPAHPAPRPQDAGSGDAGGILGGILSDLLRGRR